MRGYVFFCTLLLGICTQSTAALDFVPGVGDGRAGVTKRVQNTSQIRKPVTKCERMRSGGTELWCPRLRDERGAPPGQARPTPTHPEPSGGGRGPLQVIMNIITMTIYKSRMRLAPALSRALLSSVPAATSKARTCAIGGGGHRGHPSHRAGGGGGPRGALGGTCARREAR